VIGAAATAIHAPLGGPPGGASTASPVGIGCSEIPNTRAHPASSNQQRAA